jgi:hypothetical protein
MSPALRSLAFLSALVGAPAVVPVDLHAQNLTTAAVSGTVRDASGAAIDAAEIHVINRSTGVATGSRSRADGRYTVQGLDVGGPYSVLIARIGFAPYARDGIFLTLSQDLRLDVVLEALVTELPGIVVEADTDPRFSASRMGVASTISDSLLRRLPALNRDLYSFLTLVPQLSTITEEPVPSGGGVNYRFNSMLVDGASDQAPFGRNAGGAIWGGKAISIEAVKEYQVLLSPYDVRQGGFAGAAINAVTKSGSNRWQGTAFVYGRSEGLARDVAFLRASPYDRAQFGASLGGPIVPDRVHVLVAAEFQHLSAPSLGPYVGQPASSQTPLPVDPADVTRFTQLLQRYGLQAGSAGPLSNTNPARNWFGRLDVALPRWNSRLVLRENYSRADTNAFSRPSPSSACGDLACFPFSSVERRQEITKSSTTGQLYTSLPSGAYNELIAGYNAIHLSFTPNVRAPLVMAAAPDAVAAGVVYLQSGSLEFAQDNELRQRVLELTDNLTLPSGPHRITIGGTVQLPRLRSRQLFGSYGTWQFLSLDSLELGSASDYRVTQDFGGADASLHEAQYGAYVGDQWQVGRRFAITSGLRLDVPVLTGRPPYAALVDSVYGRRTDVVPSGQALWSPRVGFNWDISGDGRQQLRGGLGLFVGQPPMAWLIRAFQNFGSGLQTLHCNAAAGSGPPPPFPASPDYRAPVLACANQVGIGSVAAGPVNLVDPELKSPQTLRASLGYDRRLPWGMVATLEALYTKGVHDFVFVNRNLAGPDSVDRNGRVMYGGIGSLGTATPDLVPGAFPAAIELRNQSRDYAYNLTAELEKRFSNRLELRAAYSYSRTRDVQSQLYLAFDDNWRFGRVLAGRHDDLRIGVSDFDRPHRIVIVGTFAAPWKTDISFYYVGTSGVPFTYATVAAGGTGDLNADGSNLNDPVYVPANTADMAEIRFSGSVTEVAAQQAAFAAFIARTPCLRGQRGQIVQRNSCRSPWVHSLNLSVRQSVSFGGHTVSAECQVFNFLNLVNSRWGHVQVPNDNDAQSRVGVLEQVGQTPGAASQSQGVFHYDPGFQPFSSQNLQSNYQIQLGARYSF